LGLNAKGFTSGIDGATKSLANFTTRVAGMFVAFRGIEGVVDYFKDLHQRLADIGFAAHRLGESSSELSRWGEVSRLVGGDAHDAMDSIEGFQNAIFNLQYRGQLSDQLAMLQRFGIAYLDAAGHARNFRDIARDAAKVIDRQATITGADQGQRQQLAQAFGFSGGIATAVARGGESLELALKKAAEDQRNITDKAIDANVAFEQRQISREARRDSANTALLNKLLPSVDAVQEKITELIEKAIPQLIHAMDVLGNFIQHPPSWLTDITNLLGPGGSLVAGLLGVTAAVGVGSTLVTGITALTGALLRQAGVASAVVSAGIATGIGLDWLDEKFNKGRILGTTAPVPEVLGGMLEWLSGTRYNPNSGSRNFTSAQLQQSWGIPTPAAARPVENFDPLTLPGTESDHKWLGPTTGAGSVRIDSIVISTQATDANGIAGSISDALRRKLNVANADGGQG
jgi:NAD(P)-dependent dehydrogenase (short-subunit alcohol dehydrogenase family)